MNSENHNEEYSMSVFGPDFHFKLMAIEFKLRDSLLPRSKVLGEVGIERGFQVLDFGCGPGGYIAATSTLVGNEGAIYALDMRPIALSMVEKTAAKKRLENVKTICSYCETGLPDGSIDVVLLYDTFHNLDHPDDVLKELHRVLKRGGILSFSDHHMKDDEIIESVTAAGLFLFLRKGRKTYSFSRLNAPH